MNNKAYRIGFFALLVINLALVMFFISMPKPPSQGANIMEEVSSKLDFNEEQKNRFVAMAKLHREQMMALNKQERELTREYFSHLRQENQEAQLQDLVNSIQTVQESKLKLTYNHFEEVKTICNADQIAHFDDLLDDIMRVLTGENNRPARQRTEDEKR